MRWSRVTSVLWVLALGLWGATVRATISASDRLPLSQFEYMFTRPVWTAFAATLSIGLVAWQLSRPVAQVGVMYSLGFRHGVRSVVGGAAEDEASTVTSIHSRR